MSSLGLEPEPEISISSVSLLSGFVCTGLLASGCRSCGSWVCSPVDYPVGPRVGCRSVVRCHYWVSSHDLLVVSGIGDVHVLPEMIGDGWSEIVEDGWL